MNFLSTLPTEILCNIFELCPLRDQLVLAKVSKLLRQIIRDIFRRKYKYFNYNYLTFKYSLQLQNYEISELCCLCGTAVERARFSTSFNKDLLKHIGCNGIRANPMENVKYFINDNFIQNVKYFTNLKELNVQGSLIQGETILALAKHCKKLKTLCLMDTNNFSLWGKHLQDLESIENLDLKFCPNFNPNHLLAVSQRRQLKCLNIVECDYLSDIPIPKIMKLCDHWHNLETLRLAAFSQDELFLKTIINLPALKTLQFYCIDWMPIHFEDNFFLQLALNEKKSLQLKHIKFENDRYYIKDESLLQLTPQKYAIMRENVCINGQLWHWDTIVFDKISRNFHTFKNLLTLSFYYCRLLDYEQIKHLSLINGNLKLIKVYGCPKKEDKQSINQWLQDGMSSKCQLSLESFLPLQMVMDLQAKANPRNFSSFYQHEPVLRSIECQF